MKTLIKSQRHKVKRWDDDGNPVDYDIIVLRQISIGISYVHVLYYRSDCDRRAVRQSSKQNLYNNYNINLRYTK